MNKKIAYYTDYEKFKKALFKLNITSRASYEKLHSLNPKLPPRPQAQFPEWEGWRKLLRGRNNNFYKSYTEASKAAIQLGITRERQYGHLRKLDPKLPSAPYRVYSAKWLGWPVFLGNKPATKANKKRYKRYLTLNEASIAAQRLGVTTAAEYFGHYKADPLLPYYPNIHYIKEWDGWHEFLGKQKSKRNYYKNEPYEHLAQARRAARKLNIKTKAQYAKLYSNNPRLTESPEITYAHQWKGWDYFFNFYQEHRKPECFYKTLKQATAAAKKLNVTTARQYIKSYKQDPMLHSNPQNFYKDWKDWETFLGAKDKKRKYYKTLAQASKAVKRLGITNARQYIKRYKEDPLLPSTPYTFYDNWVSWPALCK